MYVSAPPRVGSIRSKFKANRMVSISLKGRDGCKPRPSSFIIRIPAGPDWNVFGGLSPQTPLDRSNPLLLTQSGAAADYDRGTVPALSRIIRACHPGQRKRTCRR